ncbi:MAG: zinc metalloprotease HtpX [Candidatus Omnitrophica bacterium]|nr:zinc metalloprotease HtpX [Candidatus Omnitrophota bacterium]
MPYSFIEIERRKTYVIKWVFVFLVLFYFIVAQALWTVTKLFFFIQFESLAYRHAAVFSLKESLMVFAFALIVALGHWYFSTNNMIERILRLIGAGELDLKDAYHQVFKNVIEEVCVATGNIKQIRPRIVSISGLNAFAVSDLRGGAVIGITEGLLGRLNRGQLEAVVAHEAAHIVSEDSLTNTVTCSLFAVYAALLEGITKALRFTSNGRGRREGGAPIAYLAVLYVILSITQLVSLLLNMFLSRQQEYRADAVAVKLTRNPISFAEALYIISRGWRGVGGVSDSLAPIFIMSPDYNNLEERGGLVSDLFSTHPPTLRRLMILLGMAHSDMTALKTGVKPKVRLTAEKGIVELKDTPGNKEWLLYKDDDWKGPFGPDELFTMGLSPNSWVSKTGENIIEHASEDKDLYRLFKEKLLGEDREIKDGEDCPVCKQPLTEALYEGAPIARCGYCGGILAGSDVILRIITREDFAFGPEIARSAEALLREYSKGIAKDTFKVAYSFNCPECKVKMMRGFFSYGFPVQVDKCQSCRKIWFDKDEMEILQYLSEKVRSGN